MSNVRTMQEIKEAVAKSDVEDLKSEIQRLRDAKRRALALADERAIKANELRLENERLRAQLAEQDRS